MAEGPTPWRNRIVGHAEVDPRTLMPHPLNFRLHPDEQEAAVAGLLHELGVIDEITVQAGTSFILDGHLRHEIALDEGQATVIVRYLDVDDEDGRKVLATKDASGAMAAVDNRAIAALLAQISVQDPAIQAMLDELAGGDAEREPYSARVESPLYEPTGAQPSLVELIDTRRFDALASGVMLANVPDDVKGFLMVAAHRHIVFNYQQIAEFYAHADAATQRLMEDSALVIVDIERAIELGYASLRTEMLDAIADARARG